MTRGGAVRCQAGGATATVTVAAEAGQVVWLFTIGAAAGLLQCVLLGVEENDNRPAPGRLRASRPVPSHTSPPFTSTQVPPFIMRIFYELTYTLLLIKTTV